MINIFNKIYNKKLNDISKVNFVSPLNLSLWSFLDSFSIRDHRVNLPQRYFIPTAADKTQRAEFAVFFP